MIDISLNENTRINELYAYMSKISEEGIKVADKNTLYELFNIIEKHLNDIEQKVNEEYGIQNIRSSKQIQQFIINYSAEKFGYNSNNDIIRVCMDEYTGKISSKEENLVELEGMGYEFAHDILEYRKAKNTFDCIKNLYNMSDEDNRVHPKVNLGSTNRLQWSEPALMSIPKDILWSTVIKARNKDEICYSADIKNQEPCLISIIAGSKEISEAVKSSDGIYNYFFKKCYKPKAYCYVLNEFCGEGKISKKEAIGNINYIAINEYESTGCNSVFIEGTSKKVTLIKNEMYRCNSARIDDSVEIVTEERDENGKAVNEYFTASVEWNSNPIIKNNLYTVFEGDIKGLSIVVNESDRREFKTNWLAFTYGRILKGKKGRYINLDKMDKLMESVGLNEYKKKMQNLSKKTNYIDTLFGSRIYFDEHMNSYQKRTAAMNYPIQGSGADMLSILVYKIIEKLAEERLEEYIKVYFTRHDEIVYSISKKFEEEKGIEWVTNKIKEVSECNINNVSFLVEVTRHEQSENR